MDMRLEKTGPVRIGFDIGGTFTDFVLDGADAGSVRLHKNLTSYPNPSDAALEGLTELLRKAELDFADVDEILHGTTLVTNALVERKGARLGLLTTAGFRDTIEAGREQRYDIYDLFLTFPEPIVSRQFRLEIDERLDRDGNVVVPAGDDQIRRQLGRLRAAGVEAVAVCFLHSYRNPAHEKRVGEIARAEFPELFVSLSSEVVAEMWEYQRMVTTCANAYVMPLIDRHLVSLDRELRARGFRGELRMMHSAGGLMTVEAARSNPVRLLESGPAGGGLASAMFGGKCDRGDLISFDMGGTTAKACLIENGEVAIATELEAARVNRFTKGSGLPIRTPVIDLIEIGAGGGSIAEVDRVGLLKVGPRSAGSVPGPACYGKGGTEPTVTDANLLLGYYDPTFFLGGRMPIDIDAARRAIEGLADALGLSAEEAAAGIHDLVVENMAAAARVHIVEKGKDPRSFAMIAFGGAGPAHAVDVARVLGVREVIVPPASGAASALGFLAAAPSFETVRSLRVEVRPETDFAEANAILRDLQAASAEQVAALGVPSGEITATRFADMRLVGQMHEVTVELPAGPLGPAMLSELVARFEADYTRQFSAMPEGVRPEITNLRVRCSARVPDLEARPHVDRETGEARKGTRRAWFGEGYVETTVYDRYALVPGDTISGPAIIEETESTTIVPPRCTVGIDQDLSLRIEVAVDTSKDLGLGDDPGEEAIVARLESDPVTLEIMWSRLVSVTEEMWHTVCRTAFSLVISEAQDFACDLLDLNGDTLAHSPRAMPVFNLTLPRAVKALLEAYPVETLQPGDVLITNDPWLCAGHLFDIAVVTPIFHKGRVVALSGTVGNVNDIGGTRDWLSAREVYEEGFQIPPMKLYEAGRPNRTLFSLLEKNVRTADQVLGDLAALVAANEIGAQRLTSFMADYVLDDIGPLARLIQRKSETAMRRAIAALPDGVYRSESWNNPFGTPMRLPVALEVAGDEIRVDFEGAPPQLAKGGINCTLSYTAAHGAYPIKCMLTPEVRSNAGCYRPISIDAPEGSILNARYPASVNLRTRTGWYIAPAIFSALAPAAPERVLAPTGLPFTSNIYGDTADGGTYADVLFAGGGQGASARGDGKSGLLWPTSASNTSIELFESRVPILVLEKSFIADSGGPGRHRGGLGQRMRFRRLDRSGGPMLSTLYPEGVTNPAGGLFGGGACIPASARIHSLDGAVLRDCETGALVEIETDEEIVDVVVAGGAGYGDPSERSPEMIEADLEAGLVTPKGAERDYGYRAEPGAESRTAEAASR
ncbi:MAG: hydantoinase B/oxoprolinase family protein [Roseitalea porphyridii]|uniref:hydantoinase B/oxoprolinase family protein n=1 Tax=Roseitalea porphyridii TaxID=1852022 RepID=UPI0032D99730